ncbi:hypothetical protein [Nisaea sp.]|uniref:hypothetical protein n=1 Tax=Nisaea sp. TaxID=2024842 RepID=UPI003B5270F3
MTVFSEHGDYSIGTDGRILQVFVTATLNSEMMARYSREMSELADAMTGRPFASYIEYLTDAILMLEAIEKLRPGIQERQRKGLCAVAFNVSKSAAPSIVAAKSGELYDALGLPWKSVQDYDAARPWLLEQIDAAEKQVRPDRGTPEESGPEIS